MGAASHDGDGDLGLHGSRLRFNTLPHSAVVAPRQPPCGVQDDVQICPAGGKNKPWPKQATAKGTAQQVQGWGSLAHLGVLAINDLLDLACPVDDGGLQALHQVLLFGGLLGVLGKEGPGHKWAQFNDACAYRRAHILAVCWTCVRTVSR